MIAPAKPDPSSRPAGRLGGFGLVVLAYAVGCAAVAFTVAGELNRLVAAGGERVVARTPAPAPQAVR